MARIVSIGFRDNDALEGFLKNMVAQFEADGEVYMNVQGNGGPDLELRLMDENDEEWPAEPLVDYSEG